MTDALIVPANEQGRVRLFALDMPPAQIRFQQEPGAVEALLQTDALDPVFYEIFDVADLEGLGLIGYLVEGCGIPEVDIAPRKQALEAMTGHVLVVLSRAFGGRAATLVPARGVQLVGMFAEEPTDWTSAPIPSESAMPYSAARPSPRVARSQARRIGGALFAAMMTMIAVVLILVMT